MITTSTAKRVNLTNREKQVLQAIADGKSFHGAARELGMAYETVHSHTRNIYRKLKVRSRMEAIIFAYKEKVIE